MMMEREGRALPGASPESRESAPKRSLQGGRRDSNICACPSSPTDSRAIPGLVPSRTIESDEREIQERASKMHSEMHRLSLSLSS